MRKITLPALSIKGMLHEGHLSQALQHTGHRQESAEHDDSSNRSRGALGGARGAQCVIRSEHNRPRSNTSRSQSRRIV